MAGIKQSTLPTVLKEYMPEYEPQYSTSTVAKTKHSDQKTDDRGKPGQFRGHGTHSGKHDRKSCSRSANQGSRESQSRGKGRGRRRTADLEHFESVSATWELAKSEVRQERHQQLQEKLVLQQHLLRLQDELQQHRLNKDQRIKQQQQERERKKKQTQQAALQEVCRQSLEDDRKSAASNRKPKSETPRSNDDSSDITSKSSGSTPRENRRRATRQRPPVARSPTLPKSPMRELEVEDDEDEADLNQSATSSDLDSLPWHHAQLYRLYGNEADYFIHPKIEPKATVPVTRKVKKNTGHLGAEELWTSLRGESKTRLLREDGRFPHDLKDAYSAFVRQSLTLGRHPVRRNYTATEDVPDMDRLLDQSLLYNIRKYRHKTELMYRASRANNDRTNILLYNNPLPDINDENAGSIIRYLPSWLDEFSDVSEPEYMKWLALRSKVKAETPSKESKVDQDPDTKMETSRSNADTADAENEFTKLTLALEGTEHSHVPKPAPRQKSKLLFLTEKDATTPGEFSHKYKRQRENKNIPAAHMARPIDVHPHSAMGFSRQDDTDVPPSPRRSLSTISREDLLQRFKSDWQPLSMNALVEYTQERQTEGKGQFDHGRMKMWPVVMTS